MEVQSLCKSQSCYQQCYDSFMINLKLLNTDYKVETITNKIHNQFLKIEI